MAIDQIAQSGLSSLKVIYYSAQLFSEMGVAHVKFEINDEQRDELVEILAQA